MSEFPFLWGWLVSLCIAFCISILLSEDTWAIATFWLLWMTLLWTQCTEASFETLSFDSLGYILKVEFLDHMVILYLIFWGTSKLFSIMAVPFSVPFNSTWGLQLLHNLANIYYFLGCFLKSPFRVWGGILLWFWLAVPWWPGLVGIFSRSHRTFEWKPFEDRQSIRWRFTQNVPSWC